MRIDLEARRRRCAATSSSGSWSTSSTSATTSTSTAARSACAATWSRSSRPTRRTARSASSSSATRSRRSSEIDPLRGVVRARASTSTSIYPGSHYVTPEEQRARRCSRSATSCTSASRSSSRRASCSSASASSSARMYDLEMLEQMGFCTGIENYSRHLSGRKAGRAAAHADRLLPRGLPARPRRVAPDRAADRRDVRRRPQPQADARRLRVPPPERARQPAAQVRGVPEVHAPDDLRLGDARRLRAGQAPRAWSSSRSSVRPACSIPRSTCAPSRARSTICSPRSASASRASERVLVTTLTKRMAEDLTEYYRELGVRVRYLHSDVDTLERIEILRDLRRGEFDVLVGINLLREGLDLPEVSLVAILDADKEGFLRSPRSLIQTIGRAARNVNGRGHHVRRQGDRRDAGTRSTRPRAAARCRPSTTRSTASRRRPIIKPILEIVAGQRRARLHDASRRLKPGEASERRRRAESGIELLREQMLEAAEALDFERAAALRDQVRAMQKQAGRDGGTAAKSGAYAGGVGSAAYGGAAAPAKKKSPSLDALRLEAKPGETRGPRAEAHGIPFKPCFAGLSRMISRRSSAPAAIGESTRSTITEERSVIDANSVAARPMVETVRRSPASAGLQRNAVGFSPRRESRTGTRAGSRGCASVTTSGSCEVAGDARSRRHRARRRRAGSPSRGRRGPCGLRRARARIFGARQHDERTAMRLRIEDEHGDAACRRRSRRRAWPRARRGRPSGARRRTSDEVWPSARRRSGPVAPARRRSARRPW